MPPTDKGAILAEELPQLRQTSDTTAKPSPPLPAVVRAAVVYLDDEEWLAESRVIPRMSAS
jgi:hypothetical protein